MEGGAPHTGSAPAANHMVATQQMNYSHSYEPMSSASSRGKAMLETPQEGEHYLHPPNTMPPLLGSANSARGLPPAPAPSPNEDLSEEAYHPGLVNDAPLLPGVIGREKPFYKDQQTVDTSPENQPKVNPTEQIGRPGAFSNDNRKQVNKSMLAYSDRVKALAQRRSLSLRSTAKMDYNPQTGSPVVGRRWVTLPKVNRNQATDPSQENLGILLGSKAGNMQSRSTSGDNFRPSSEMTISTNPRKDFPSPVQSPLRPVSDPLSSLSSHVNMLHNSQFPASKRYGSDQNILQRTKLHGETNVLTLNPSPEVTLDSLPVNKDILSRDTLETIKIVPFPAIEVQAVPVVLHDNRKNMNDPTKPNLKQPLANKNLKRPYFLSKSVLPPIPKVAQAKGKLDHGSSKSLPRRTPSKGSGSAERHPPRRRTGAPLLSGSRAPLHDKVNGCVGVPKDKGDRGMVSEYMMNQSIQVDFPEDPDNPSSIVIPSAGYASDEETTCGSEMSVLSNKSSTKTGEKDKMSSETQITSSENKGETSNSSQGQDTIDPLEKGQNVKKPRKSFTPRKLKSPTPGANKNVKSLHGLHVRFGGMKSGDTSENESEEEVNNSVDSQAALKPSVIKSVLKKRGSGGKSKNVKFGAELEFIRMVTKIEYPWYNDPSSDESESGEDDGEEDENDNEEEEADEEEKSEESTASSDEDSEKQKERVNRKPGVNDSCVKTVDPKTS